MCQKAAQSLLEGLHWNPAEIELLIFVSQTRDYLIPQTSNILQHKLGLPTTAISLDISLGCSGYVYGLAVASAMMNSFGISKALLLVGDISSAIPPIAIKVLILYLEMQEQQLHSSVSKMPRRCISASRAMARVTRPS